MMKAKDIDRLLRDYPALFAEALVANAHRMENYYYYSFRPLDVNLDDELSYESQPLNRKIARASKNDHAGKRILTATMVAIHNKKQLETPIADIHEDVNLYSNVDDNNVIGNGAKAVSYFGQAVMNHRQKGSRIELVSSKKLSSKRMKKTPKDDDHKITYFVFSHQDNLYHLNIEKNNVEEVFKRFEELLARRNINIPIDVSNLRIDTFEKLIMRHCDRTHMQHGWTYKKRIKRMEPDAFIRSLIIGKDAKQSLSVLALLGLLSFITPIISVVANILATEAAIYMVYKEHKMEAYRREHLGRNPPQYIEDKINAEARFFALQAVPCSLYIGFSMLKDMGVAGVMLQPIEHFVHDISKSVFSTLSLDFYPGMLLLSGFAMAVSITAIAMATMPESRKQKGALPLIFAMSFAAGLIFACASMITGSNRYLEASMVRTAEEIVSAVTTLMLFIGIYHTPLIARKLGCEDHQKVAEQEPDASTSTVLRFRKDSKSSSSSSTSKQQHIPSGSLLSLTH